MHAWVGAKMKSDVADIYRRCVEDLVVAQNGESPACPFDGKPCLTPERGCTQHLFGTLASDGKEELVYSCPRFKEGSS